MGEMLTTDVIERHVRAMGELVESGRMAEATAYEAVLWRTTLAAIADGMWDAKDLAEEALRTRSYRFRRTYRDRESP